MASKVIRNREEAENEDKATESISAEVRKTLDRIVEKRRFWAEKFLQEKIKFVETANGFIIHEADHTRAMNLLKMETPVSAETAALYFNYADLSNYNE